MVRVERIDMNSGEPPPQGTHRWRQLEKTPFDSFPQGDLQNPTKLRDYSSELGVASIASSD
jgi:hypothetical protein